MKKQHPTMSTGNFQVVRNLVQKGKFNEFIETVCSENFGAEYMCDAILLREHIPPHSNQDRNGPNLIEEQAISTEDFKKQAFALYQRIIAEQFRTAQQLQTEAKIGRCLDLLVELAPNENLRDTIRGTITQLNRVKTGDKHGILMQEYLETKQNKYSLHTRDYFNEIKDWYQVEFPTEPAVNKQREKRIVLWMLFVAGLLIPVIWYFSSANDSKAQEIEIGTPAADRIWYNASLPQPDGSEPAVFTYDEAVSKCTALGQGFTLPTVEDFIALGAYLGGIQADASDPDSIIDDPEVSFEVLTDPTNSPLLLTLNGFYGEANTLEYKNQIGYYWSQTAQFDNPEKVSVLSVEGIGEPGLRIAQPPSIYGASCLCIKH